MNTGWAVHGWKKSQPNERVGMTFTHFCWNTWDLEQELCDIALMLDNGELERWCVEGDAVWDTMSKL